MNLFQWPCPGPGCWTDNVAGEIPEHPGIFAITRTHDHLFFGEEDSKQFGIITNSETFEIEEFDTLEEAKSFLEKQKT